MQYLLSDSEEYSDVKQVRVQDRGSKPRKVKVVLGVRVLGVVDTVANVTIVVGDVFKQVAAACKLHKRDFMVVDKTQFTYDRKPFRLDGKLEVVP